MQPHGSVCSGSTFSNIARGPTVALVFLAAHLLPGTRRYKPSKGHMHLIFGGLVALCFLNSVHIAFYVHSVLALHMSTFRDCEFQLISSFMIELNLLMVMLKIRPSSWRPYVAACTTGILFDTFRLGYDVQNEGSELLVLLYSIRLAISVGLTITFYLANTRSDSDSPELQPLLGRYVAQNENQKQQERQNLETPSLWKGFLLLCKDTFSMNATTIRFLVFKVIITLLYLVQPYLEPQMYSSLIDKDLPRAKEQWSIDSWGAAKIALWGAAKYVLVREYKDLFAIDSCDTIVTLISSNWASKSLVLATLRYAMKLGPGFHSQASTSLVTTAIQQCASLTNALEQAFNFVVVLIRLILALCALGQFYGRFQLYTTIYVAHVHFWSAAFLVPWADEMRQELVLQDLESNNILQQMVNNYETVVDTDNVGYECDRYETSFGASLTASLWWNIRHNCGHLVRHYNLAIGYYVSIILVAYSWVKGDATWGNVVALALFWQASVGPLQIITASYKHIRSKIIDCQQAVEIRAAEPTVTEPEVPLAPTDDARVEFENVSFEYKAGIPVLRNISFTVESGQRIAFVGASGSGKSTLLSLLRRHYDVTDGAIHVCGQDVRRMTQQSIKSCIGVISQQAAILDGSILQNITYGNREATEDQVQAACKAAGIHDEIMKRNEGYQTKAGANAALFSGGEVQRLLIARLIVQGPRIALLDEVTAALDSDNEVKVNEALRDAMKGRTTITVAHRLSTISDADHIYVLDDGSIIEHGTHSELLKLGGKYTSLWGKQQGKTAESSQTSARSIPWLLGL